MTLTQMQYFISVAKCLNFSEAAKILFITQPALSRQITKIESELNIQLFIRGSKELRLTPAGACLLAELPKVLTSYNQAIQKAEASSRALTGTLKIGVLDGHNASSLLSPLLHMFRKQNPHIKIFLERFTFKQLTNRLYDGTLDLSITYDFDIHGKQGLSSRILETTTPALIIPNTNPLSQKKNLSLADCKDETFVIVKQEDCMSGVELVALTCKKYGGFYPNFEYVDTMQNVILWLESGIGISLLNEASVIKDSPFVTCHLLNDASPDALPQMNVLLVWHKQNTNPALPLFLNY